MARSRTIDRRGGLSRVEVVLVVVVIVLLVATLAPALLDAREWSRSRQCQYNLRLLGEALHSYHSLYNVLPPASFWDEAEMIVDEDLRPARSPETVHTTRQNWAQLVLSELGELELAAELRPELPVTDEANRAARTTRLAVMTCPSDTYNMRENPYVLELEDGSRYEFARGNYAINGGSHGNVEYPGRLSFPVTDGNVIVFRSEEDEFHWRGNGAAGFNACLSFDDFRNGLSSTVLLDEIRAGIVPEDSRGAWALGQIGASVTWAHGVNGDDFGPNNQLPDSDDILEGRTIAKKYGMERFYQARMPFCAHCSYSNQATARSQHPGGVNVLTADGAARFVSDAVNPGLWHVMHSRETPPDVLRRLDALLAEAAASGDTPRAPSTYRLEDPRDLPEEETAAAPLRHRPESIVNSIGMRLVRVPAGAFVMGLPDAENTWPYPSGDAPPHRVRLTRPFLLGACEVTQQEFEAVMGRNTSWHRAEGEGASLVGGESTARRPVENVTWDEAAEFCRRLSDLPEERAAGRHYRLPTEAEWEYACRAGSSVPYPFDVTWLEPDDFTEIAGKEKHATREPLVPHAVGNGAPNAFGLHDMRGNVFEWTADWFERSYYSASPVDDPPGPKSGYLKVIRGWDWVFIGPQCKDFHFVTPPWIRSRFVGFRVAADEPAP